MIECIVCEVGTAYESDNESGLDGTFEKPIDKALATIGDFSGSVVGMHWIEYQCKDCGSIFKVIYASIEATQIIKRSEQ